jgi:hypothetical protein
VDAFLLPNGAGSRVDLFVRAHLLFIVETCATPVCKTDIYIARTVGDLLFLLWSYSQN